METESTTRSFEARALSIIDESRGLINLLKAVKASLSEKAKSDKLYQMTLKRLRNNALLLAGLFEACSLLVGEKERDELLKKFGCLWDSEKRRVFLG